MFKTKSQAVHVSSNGAVTSLSQVRKPEDKHFEKMLVDPAIELAISIVTGLLLQQPWSVEGDDEDRNLFMWGQLEPYRKFLIESALWGFLLDGYRIFESMYKVEQADLGLRQTLGGIKPLRADLTDIAIDKETGDVLGAIVRSVNGVGEKVFIDRDQVIFVNLDREGYGDYGKPMLRIAQYPCYSWDLCEDGAQRYDEKVAGGFLHIKYPVGSSPLGSEDNEVENSEIAESIAHSVRSSGYACTPVNIDDEGSVAALIEAWQIQYVAQGANGQPSFVARAKYLDALKMRSFGVPERSATEGSLGTKAEAEAHADIAIMVNTQKHERIVGAVNSQLVEPMNRSSFLEPGATRLVLGDLSPESRELFTAIFTSIMADPLAGSDVAARIDIDQLLDKLKIPAEVEQEFSEGPDDG